MRRRGQGREGEGGRRGQGGRGGEGKRKRGKGESREYNLREHSKSISHFASSGNGWECKHVGMLVFFVHCFSDHNH